MDRQQRVGGSQFEPAAGHIGEDAAGADAEQRDGDREEREVVVHDDREDARQRELGHQIAERSFALWGKQMPVCARCTGLYIGGAVAALASALRVRRDSGIGTRDSTNPEPRTTNPGITLHTRSVLFLAALPTVATL